MAAMRPVSGVTPWPSSPYSALRMAEPSRMASGMESKSHVTSPSRTHRSHVMGVAQELGAAIGELDMVIA